MEESNDSLRYVVPVASKAELSFITAPEGFEVSKNFNGYMHFGVSTAIIMTMIDDVNYIKIAESMTDEYFKENKLSLISESKIISEFGIKGIQYKLDFIIGEKEFIRYIVYAGNLNKTLWLNITYSKSNEELVEPEILKAINSINFNTPGK
ncbi:MAG: hypothetical protein ACJA0U_000410 [Salibacteraceae bacterium]